MTAQYRVTARTFIAPHTIEPGSKIATNAEPSLTWEPLNAEANEAVERLYNKEYTYTNEKGETVTTQPHLNKRPQPIVNPNAERPTVMLLEAPKPSDAPTLSLAESAFSRAEPDLIPQGDGTSALRSAQRGPEPTVIEPGAQSVDGTTTILEAAPPQPKLI